MTIMSIPYVRRRIYDRYNKFQPQSGDAVSNNIIYDSGSREVIGRAAQAERCCDGEQSTCAPQQTTPAPMVKVGLFICRKRCAGRS